MPVSEFAEAAAYMQAVLTMRSPEAHKGIKELCQPVSRALSFASADSTDESRALAQVIKRKGGRVTL
jgi:hypothetical protein